MSSTRCIVLERPLPGLAVDAFLLVYVELSPPENASGQAIAELKAEMRLDGYLFRGGFDLSLIQDPSA